MSLIERAVKRMDDVHAAAPVYPEAELRDESTLEKAVQRQRLHPAQHIEPHLQASHPQRGVVLEAIADDDWTVGPDTAFLPNDFDDIGRNEQRRRIENHDAVGITLAQFGEQFPHRLAGQQLRGLAMRTTCG